MLKHLIEKDSEQKPKSDFSNELNCRPDCLPGAVAAGTVHVSLERPGRPGPSPAPPRHPTSPAPALLSPLLQSQVSGQAGQSQTPNIWELSSTTPQAAGGLLRQIFRLLLHSPNACQSQAGQGWQQPGAHRAVQCSPEGGRDPRLL